MRPAPGFKGRGDVKETNPAFMLTWVPLMVYNIRRDCFERAP